MEEAQGRREVLPRATDQHNALVAKLDDGRLVYRGAKLGDVKEFSPQHAAAAHPLADSITLCMTAYNEPVHAYHQSLNAMARNADYFARAGYPHVSRNLTICIVVDGLESMSDSFAEHARKLGIFDPARLVGDCDYHIFETTIERRLLHLSPEARSDRAREPVEKLLEFRHGKDGPELANPQRIVLFIKQRNRGKLDSHRCFFEILCRPARPAFFLQLDVGTDPQDAAVYQMWRNLKVEQNIAAVSARSHMPVPQGATDILGAWQYGDIASERILLWPTELLMGYMSVLSGQLCLTRSDSVWCDETDGSEKATGKQAAALLPTAMLPVPENDSEVMSSYLRGLQPLGPFESSMFLAEDRILGLEIVFQRDSRWELGYVPEADAEIDRCDTWNELLCQRRRWTCSSIACRLWMFTRISDYVSSANRTLSQKARIATASVFHSAYFLMQWLMPAFAVMIFTSLHNLAAATVSASPLFQGVVHASFSAVLCLLAVQLAVAWKGRLDAATSRFYSASIAFQTIYVMATTAIIIGGNFTHPDFTRPLLLLGVVVMALLSLSAWYAREIFHGYTRSLLQYWFSRPAVAFLIMTYSALNSHNTSWGTKGLNRPHYANGGAKRQFDRFRLKTVGTMLTANVLFYLYAVDQGWTSSHRGLEIVLWLIAAQTAFAFVARIAIEIRSRLPRRVHDER